MIRNLLIIPLFFSLLAAGQPSRPVPGRVQGNWPFLEYGLGQDRLGGAKIGYIDTSILVQVIDSTINRYRIQLSKNHFAYIDKSYVKKDSTLPIRPYYLTNSWLVHGDEHYDYVTISLDEKLPYRSMQQINPSRIVVDIFGATSNTNWITQRSTAKTIRNVYHEQVEDDVFRVVIELQQAQHWGYSIYYMNGNRLVIRVKRPPRELDLDHLKIAVDAGHGGDNPGASGTVSRIREKDYTLMIAKELARELVDQNARVFMTRITDTSLTMNDRLTMLRTEDPDLLVSIHLNSSTRDSIKGVSTYYRYIGFRPVTLFILNRLLETGLVEFGNIGSFNFTLSGPTEYPNCLVEVAFLSNREDEKRILDPRFHRDVAKKIVEGIRDWLKYCKDDR
jgi:N-acetylmuramoyl-L-alanine amidase